MGSYTWSRTGLQPWWAWDRRDFQTPSLPFSGPDHWGCPMLTWMLPTRVSSFPRLLVLHCSYSSSMFLLFDGFSSVDIWPSFLKHLARVYRFRFFLPPNLTNLTVCLVYLQVAFIFVPVFFFFFYLLLPAWYLCWIFFWDETDLSSLQSFWLIFKQ